MLNKKYLFFSFFALGLPLAHAGSLTIINNTNQFSTSIINKGMCSSGLGKVGVTEPGGRNVVDEKIILLACGLAANHCQADVYLTKNCTGPVLTTVVFDIKTGIKSVTPPGIPGYTITHSDFMFTLSPV